MTAAHTNQETWQTALQWVESNRPLIRRIAAPYLRHMAADSDDLLQEAALAAFQALRAVRRKQAAGQFTSYFRVIFKTHCLKLASGIQTVHSLEDYLPYRSEQEEERPTPEPRQIEQALEQVSKRQREVCTWILGQAEPVSTPELAQHFKVSRRHACRLIHNSIARLTRAA
jgi:RNA polymerase sigma factor (sigma-70 family)